MLALTSSPTPKGSILFLSKNAKAASTRYRIFQFIPFLQQQGWSCRYLGVNKEGFVSRLRLLGEARRYDIVVVQRKLFGPWFLALLRSRAKRLAFDYDDAIFLNDDGSVSKRRRQRFENVSRVADLVLAGNQYLANFSLCSTTEILPTGILYERYNNINHTPANLANEGDTTVLVWIGSRSTRKYLEHHRDLLEAIGKHFTNIKLKIIADFELQFEHLQTICIPWSEQSELTELRAANIGIAPMTDDPWTRGKCALKVIQYMACRLPVVSSNCGANAEIIRDRDTGFLCDTTADWINALTALQNPELRAQMGQCAQHIAQQQFSVESLSQRMNILFTDLAAQKVKS